MSKIAIKGHPTRGNEVIKLLEMMGGQCVGYRGFVENYYYSIDKYGNIFGMPNLPNDIKYTILTLEEFLEKYPYKVGDKVRVPEYESGVCISSMYWNGREVQYEVVTDEVEWYSAEELNKFNEPYKEETMKEPKELLIGFTKDTDGNFVINTHKDYEIKEVGGKYKLIKKQPQYPKNYDECCQYLGCGDKIKMQLIGQFTQLINARNAYWKIAGEEMGLGKPWEQDYDDRCFIIANNNGNIYTYEYHGSNNVILAFPTKEMRDIFFENFKELIEICKEFL